MSKVICDVCGTAFPETDSHCPICGCTKSPTAQILHEEPVVSADKPAGGAYAKGGRYAKNNTKRSATVSAPKTPERRRRNENKDQPSQESNKGLIAVVIVLLIAIVMVVVYIGVSVFLSGLTNQPNDNSKNPSIEATLENNEPTGTQIPCVDFKIIPQVVLNEMGESQTLDVICEPFDTTDRVTFTSDDPTVATVDRDTGVIRAVGNGQTLVTVTCGNVTKTCTVLCTFGDPKPTTEPTEPIPTAPAGFVLKLNREDFTLSTEGETWRLFKDTDTVKASDITWTVGDPAVATVKNGVVTGVDRGTTTVTATIGDQSVTCIVRCAFDAADPDEDPGITMNRDDVTLHSGENFYLYLKNPDASNVQGVEWTASEEGLVEIDGNKITALEITEKTIIYITAVHEDVEYKCTLRLYPTEQATTAE